MCVPAPNHVAHLFTFPTLVRDPVLFETSHKKRQHIPCRVVLNAHRLLLRKNTLTLICSFVVYSDRAVATLTWTVICFGQTTSDSASTSWLCPSHSNQSKDSGLCMNNDCALEEYRLQISYTCVSKVYSGVSLCS